jgi:hypothetical protein
VVGVPDARRQLERAAIEAGGAPEIGGGDAQLDELAGGAERAERPRAGDDVIELGLGEVTASTWACGPATGGAPATWSTPRSMT